MTDIPSSLCCFRNYFVHLNFSIKNIGGKAVAFFFSFFFFPLFDTGSHAAYDFKKNISAYGGYLRAPDAPPEDQSSALSSQQSSVTEQLTTNYSLGFRGFSTFLCLYRCTRTHARMHSHVHMCAHTRTYFFNLKTIP